MNTSKRAPVPKKYPNEPLLRAKEKSHGDYALNAGVAQRLKAVIREVNSSLGNTQKESLDLICTKIGRICAGDPNVKDHWDDIAGYARLIASRLP